MSRAAAIEADIEELADIDPELRRARERTGPIRVRLREPGLGTLLHLILEQQVSIDAARAMHRRLIGVVGEPVTPQAILRLDDETMRSCGFTRQKASYARGIAEAMRAGDFDPIGLATAPSAEVTGALMALRGVGPWTAANYRLWALGDRDVFPTRDLALAIGWQEIAGLDARPAYDELDVIATRWAPNRTAAAMIIWHHYLSLRGRSAA